RLSGMFEELSKAAGVANFTDDNIKIVCQKINPHAQAPLIINSEFDPNIGRLKFTYANWANYIIYKKEEIKNIINEIKGFSVIVDSELMDKIIKIQESVFFLVAD